MPLTLPQLERHLFAAADILRGKMDASAEEAEHHGPRLERALARYVDTRPVGFPPGANAAFARFLADHTPRQDGPEHGMAYDVQRFNEWTKQMSAYAHYARDGHFFRDLAKFGTGLSLLWPVSYRSFSLAHGLYLHRDPRAQRRAAGLDACAPI